MTDVQLSAGERVIFQSMRGGKAGYSPYLWILFILAGNHLLFSVARVPFLLARASEVEPIEWLMTLPSAVICVALIALWIRFKRSPGYFITDRRIIARRFLRKPIEVSLSDVTSAARFTVLYSRYGRIVSEQLTHRIVVGVRSVGAVKFGPVLDAEDMTGLIVSIAQGSVDPRALPDVHGGPARAEERTDLFIARTTMTAATPRGPLFIGPTKIIGFAERFIVGRLRQVLTITGAESPAEEIEERMFELAQNIEWGRGKSVVMDREGVSIGVEENRLTVGSGATSVVFELPSSDAQRAAKYLKATQAHPYRA